MAKTVLLVDDDDSLSTLLTACIKESGEIVEIKQVRTAEEALDYIGAINEKGGPAGRAALALPSVILLDLKLPKMSGMELLHKLKSDAKMLDIPVTVLTAMESPKDIREVYCEHANSCIIKPFDLDELRSKMKSFASYWIKYNRLPEDKAQ